MRDHGGEAMTRPRHRGCVHREGGCGRCRWGKACGSESDGPATPMGSGTPSRGTGNPMREPLTPEDRRALAWLATVIRRAGMRARRRVRRGAAVSWDALDWEPVDGPASAFADRLVDQWAVHAAWRTLSPRERVVVAATVLHADPQALVARRLHVSQTRVSQIRTRALARLRSALDAQEP